MMADAEGPERGPRNSPSPPTERVVAVMQLLSADPRRQFSLAEISRRLSLSRATGHAIMTTLVAHGWATRDPQTAGYAAGQGFVSLARPDASMLRAELKSLASEIGTQVLLTQQQGNTQAVIDVAGQGLSTAYPVSRGTTVPSLCPYGRDFVAWAGKEKQEAWLRAIGEPSALLRNRIEMVLKEIRQRRYVVERLSREALRVWAALQALNGDGEIDVVVSQLAHTLANESIIDALDDELGPGSMINVSTVNAPLFDPNGVVTLSVSAAPFAKMEGPAVRALGERLGTAARDMEQRLASRALP